MLWQPCIETHAQPPRQRKAEIDRSLYTWRRPAGLLLLTENMASLQRQPVGNYSFEPLASTDDPTKSHLPWEVKSVTGAEDGSKKTQRAGRVLSLSAIGRLAPSACVAVLSCYFIVFAILARSQDGTPVEDPTNHALLEAAKAVSYATYILCVSLLTPLQGPTVFAILFTATVGACLKALAAFALERGATVGLIEYLMASRTVSAAVTTPLRLRFFHPLIPFLLALWSLSPLGGQAALRVVSAELEITSADAGVQYLDVSNSTFLLAGASGAASFYSSVSAVFNGALISPASTKSSGQDVFGNFKVPMIEQMATQTTSHPDGWFEYNNSSNAIYSALLGLPVLGPQAGTDSNFTVETSYVYPNCSVVGYFVPLWVENVTIPSDPPSTSVNNGYGLSMSGDLSHTAADQDPRQLNFSSSIFQTVQTGVGQDNTTIVVSKASCRLTQTYVEVNVRCEGKACAAGAIRQSLRPHPPITATWFDANWQSFNGEFVNVTTPGWGLHPGEISPLEYYIVNPDSPYLVMQRSSVPPQLWQQGDGIVSQRFGQLINTFWLAGMGPDAIAGNFSSSPDNTYGVGLVNGTTTISGTVLRCDTAWLVVLLLTSLIMLCAGLLSGVLAAYRRGPDLLDGFSTLLRDNPYARAQVGSSLEDRANMARRLKAVKVRIGDVQPTADVGHVAIGTPIAEQPVKRLQKGRWYN